MVQALPIGISSYDAMEALYAGSPPAPPPRRLRAAERQYSACFIGRYVTAGPGARVRGRFKAWVDAHGGAAAVPPDFYIPLHTPSRGAFFDDDASPFLAWRSTRAAVASSRACLSLPGDELLTDRMINAFEAGCVPAELDLGGKELLASLPFPFAVPWERLVVWVNATDWDERPMDALRAALDAVGPAEEWDRRLALVERHRPDVTWSRADSRASRNVLASVALGAAGGLPSFDVGASSAARRRCAEPSRCLPPAGGRGCVVCGGEAAGE